ncbi:hypothetical protein [Caulobacter phage KcrB]|nr:hypothetical protein RW_GP068c [Caulobacter phage RW]WCA46372.1 hypothetical protein [Caulobacter phage KcrB]WCD56307.1 hypothetical protein [Caulobacter phage RLK]WNV48099.1 virion structural protein [Caulobacter phage GB2A]
MSEQIIKVKSLPGIKRDGTQFEGDNYVDGQWVRFDRGFPRKIGGYYSISKYLSEVSRALHAYTQNNLTYVHSGSASYLENFYIQNNSTSVIYNRTPASGFTASADNMWQFDVMRKSVGADNNKIIAQVAPNLLDITSTSAGAIFTGDLTATTALAAVTLPTDGDASGGIVVLHPYLFFYGVDGYVGWSVPGDPTDLSGTGSGAANVTGQKVLRGMPLRGGPGNSPSGLFWSADALIRCSFVGGDSIFQFDTISAESSLMGANAVIEYDGVFYWAGVDRFLMFNGVVREIPNMLNKNYFFDGLNYTYRQKVFAFKVPRFGEIWWCYPRGDATECTHAVIYNVREDTWYDTALPESGRSAATSPSVFRKPLLTGVLPNSSNKYKLWVHESGTDAIDGTQQQPILSFFETADFALPTTTGESRALTVRIVEPDFVQSGDIEAVVTGRFNARSQAVDSAALTIVANPTTAQEVIRFKDQRRLLRFRFTSNCIGGDYQTGQILAHVLPGDERAYG